METKDALEHRLEIYTDALKYIEQYAKNRGYYPTGLCRAITNVKSYDDPYPYDGLELYPEIYKFKPTNNEDGEYWFKRDEYGTKKRIEILKSAIIETEEKIKQHE